MFHSRTQQKLGEIESKLFWAPKLGMLDQKQSLISALLLFCKKCYHKIDFQIWFQNVIYDGRIFFISKINMIFGSVKYESQIFTSFLSQYFLPNSENVLIIDIVKSIFVLFQLKQIIKTATRLTDKTESLIDLVFTKF